MTWLRRLLLILAITNVVLAVAGELVSSAVVGLSYAVITSTYHELDDNGVIDHAKLGEVWGPAYAENWHNVADRLVGDPLAELYGLSHVVTLILVLNGVILFMAWWKVRRRDVSWNSP